MVFTQSYSIESFRFIKLFVSIKNFKIIEISAYSFVKGVYLQKALKSTYDLDHCPFVYEDGIQSAVNTNVLAHSTILAEGH